MFDELTRYKYAFFFKKCLFFFFVGVLFFCASSCGYALVGRGRTLPDTVQNIAIPIFLNLTQEPNVEIILSNSLREEFILDGRLKLKGEKEADILIKGEVTKYALRPVSFDSTDNATEYWVDIGVAVEVEDLEKNTIFLSQNFSAKWDFKVSQAITLTDTVRVEAVKKASQVIAQKIISVVIEGF